MDNFITVKTFNYLHEAYIIKGKLESEGIECFIPDELTLQTNPFYSNAMGGIKLQVREKDVPEAIEILKEGGYLTEKDMMQQLSFWVKLNEITSVIPFLKKLRVEARIFILAAFVVTVVVLVIYWITFPSIMDQLTESDWCVDRILYKGQAIQPNSLGLQVTLLDGSCSERISMRKMGSIELPGINSYEVSGHWRLNGSYITINNLDTLASVYKGIFKVDVSNNELVLESTDTKIYGHKFSLYGR